MNETEREAGDQYGGPGGSAMYRGANYQALVAAYFAALALSESRNAIPPEIPALASPSRIGAEQHWPVDDVAVWFGEGVTAWFQAKSSIQASGLPDVVEQFVRQFVHGRERARGTPLSAGDRLVLVLEDAPDWISVDLRKLLSRLGTLAPEEPPETAFQGETRLREAYERVEPMVSAALTSGGVAGTDPREVLRAARVWPISADELRRFALLTLEHYVVADRAQAPAALAVLERQFAQAGQDRVVLDVVTLRRLLADSGITLKAPPSVAPDVERLIVATGHAVDAERASTVLHAREGDVRVQRSATAHVLRALAIGNVAVVGEAGAGKSGVLSAAAASLKTAGERVVFIDATDPTMIDPRAALGLAHGFADTLTGWVDDGRPAYLLVDGLDRTRVGEVYGAVVRTMRHLRTRGAAWRVAVATREYDLQYAPDLREALPFDPAQGVPDEVRDARFGRVAHVFVRGLDDDELRQVAAASPSLATLLANAPVDARRLLDNPFNLSIAATLTRDGDVPDLSAVRDRIDLMRLWWERRIERGAALAKERVLRTVATRMIEARRLRVPVDVLDGGDADEELLSEGVVVRVGRDGQDVAFAHAVVFDYIVARLLLGRERAIATLLGADRDAFLFVLASIRIRFVDLWRESRRTFYAELAALFAEGNQRRTLLPVAARIVVENLATADDVLPLLDAHDDADIAAVRFVVRNLIHERELGRRLVGECVQPWAEVALQMARRLPRHEHDTLLLMAELLAEGPATQAQAVAIAAAARLAFFQQLDREPYSHVFMRMAIGSFIASYDVDTVMARPLLEQLLDPERLAQFGKYELEPLAYALDRVHDSGALERIYNAVFSDIPIPEGKVNIGAGSVIFNLIQDASQAISQARYVLGERFAAFVAESPRAAIRTLSGVIEHEASSHGKQSSFEVAFEGSSLSLLHDCSNLWDSDIYRNEPWRAMATAFEMRLRNGIAAGDGFIDVALAEMRAHARAAYLWRVVVRNAGASVVTAERLVLFVMQSAVLKSFELAQPAAEFLEAGYTKLAEGTRNLVDSAILALLDEDVDEQHLRWRERRIREYAQAIGRDAIVSNALRSFAPPENSEEQRDDAQRRRALTLSGGFVDGVPSTIRFGLQDLVPLDAPQAFVDAIDAADELFRAANETSKPERTADVSDTIRRLDAASRGAGEQTRAVGLDVVAALMRIGLQWNALDAHDRADFLLLVLEGLGARRAVDTESASGDDNNDGWLRLGSPNVVDDGVQVLWRLNRDGHDPRIVAALRELMRHPRAAIRAVAVANAGSLRAIDALLVWEIAEHAARDGSFIVVQSADDAARAVADLDPARYDRLRFRIYDRFVPGRIKTDYVHQLVSWAVLGTLKGDAEARRRIDPVLTEPWGQLETAELVVFDLANRVAPSSEAESGVAATMLTTLTERLIGHVDALTVQRGYNVDAYPEPQKGEAKAGIHLISEIAKRTYYISRVLGHTSETSGAGSAELDTDAFALLRPVLSALASFRFAGSAYHVVQALLSTIRAQPREALKLGLTAIQNGLAGGLVREQWAEDDVRAFVVRYVDEHRDLLEADPAALSGIMDVIDAYVDAGWPLWIDVVFKLDTIYRGDLG